MDPYLIATFLTIVLIVFEILAVTHGVDSREWIRDDPGW
jgi:hypothetical protein